MAGRGKRIKEPDQRAPKECRWKLSGGQKNFSAMSQILSRAESPGSGLFQLWHKTDKSSIHQEEPRLRDQETREDTGLHGSFFNTSTWRSSNVPNCDLFFLFTICTFLHKLPNRL